MVANWSGISVWFNLILLWVFTKWIYKSVGNVYLTKNRRNSTFVRFILQFVANFNILCDLWSFIIPEYVLYLYFKFFKGVHLKRAISSEQWTHELLKHEKFHSGKLSTIEWVVMSNHMYMVFAVPFKKKFLNTLIKSILRKKINLSAKIFALFIFRSLFGTTLYKQKLKSKYY